MSETDKPLLLKSVLTACEAIDRNGQLRSILRRARTAQDVIGLEEVDRFARSLEKIKSLHLTDQAAGAAAESSMVLMAQRNVQRYHEIQNLDAPPDRWTTLVAGWLGEKIGERRLLSEQRFQRLLRATDGDDRLQQMRRAIALLKVKTHPLAVVLAYLDLRSDSGRRQFARAYFTGASQAEPFNDTMINSV